MIKEGGAFDELSFVSGSLFFKRFVIMFLLSLSHHGDDVFLDGGDGSLKLS